LAVVIPFSGGCGEGLPERKDRERQLPIITQVQFQFTELLREVGGDDHLNLQGGSYECEGSILPLADIDALERQAGLGLGVVP